MSMKKLRLMVILLTVLSLLVAVSASVSADKPTGKKDKKTVEKPVKEKKEKKDKKKPAPAVHVPPGQAKRQGEMPEATPEPDDGPTAKVMLCHKPGTPAEKTLMLPASAVPGHLQHGDYLGPCLELSPTPSVTPTETITPTLTPTVTVTLTPTATMTPTVTPTATVTPTDTWKIAICHKPNTPAEKTLFLPPSAIRGHLGHGDYLGPCISATPTVTPTATITPTATVTPTMTPTDTWKIAICHKPGTPAEKTLFLPPSAIAGHEGHGDYLGPCIDATPTITPTETVTPTVTATEEPTETLEAATSGAVQILVCHNPYGPDQETLVLAPSAVAQHLGHGDLPGSCDDLPPETWARRLAAAFLRRLNPAY
jgi:hypothetical protein